MRTVNFGKYLTKEYLPRILEWAKCFRVDLGINTNMKLERFFGVLKDRFLSRKSNARVDELIYRLIQYFNFKIQDLLIKQVKGKTTDSAHLFNISHSRALQINSAQIQRINSNTWSVPSVNSSSTYIIKRNSIISSHTCEANCRHCGVCDHMYLCSCPQNMFGKMCKHIHAVHQQFNLLDEPMIVSEPFQYFEEIKPHTFKPVPERKSPDPNLQEKYKRISSEIDDLLELAGDSLPEATEIALGHFQKARNEIIGLLQKKRTVAYAVPKLQSSARCPTQIRF